MEIADIIKQSASELSIDSEKDDTTKQKNVKVRAQVIEFINVLIDRELYLTEQVIASAYQEEFGDDEEDKETEGVDIIDDPSFDDNIEELDEHLSIVETLAKARAYLKARHEGITGL
jgi:predicted house-cleaning noncanonical NTP pyrophosphatase (MazG superfamily)